MWPLPSICATALLLASAAHAHYELTTPPAIGFDHDKQDSGPCGGLTPDFSKNTVTDFHVDGQAVGMRLGHPQATWLFRATLDQTGTSNWTQLFPMVLQNALGFFCEPAIPAPQAWVGQRGVLGVVGKAEDGLLYSCAAVNFVSGTGTMDGNSCRNSSTEAAFSNDSELAALVTSSSSSSTPRPSTTTSTTGTTSGSSTPSQSTSAAAGTIPSEFKALGSMMAVLVMGALGAAYML